MVFLSSCGQGGIKIQANKIAILIDPEAAGKGQETIKETADIVLVSHKGAEEAAKSIKGNPFVVARAGEFEVGGVFVYSIPLFNGTDRIFLVEVDGLRFLHLGVFSGNKLPDSVMDTLERIDVLFVPCGGGGGKDPKTAHILTDEVDPSIIVPIWHKDGKVTRAAVEREFGVKNGGPLEKYKVEADHLSSEEVEVIFLK